MSLIESYLEVSIWSEKKYNFKLIESFEVKFVGISISFNMPKKMGINQKAAEARERKATAKKSAQDQAAKAADDALWADNDRLLAKKKSRKEEEERKKAEAIRKKAEAKALLEQEMASIKPSSKPSIQKVTQAQIQMEAERRNKVIENINKPKEVSTNSNENFTIFISMCDV